MRFIEAIVGLGMIAGFAVVLVILFIMYYAPSKRQRDWKRKINKGNQQYYQQQAYQQPIQQEVPIYPFTKKYILTRKEYYFYRALQKTADKYNLEIWAKVRLADIIEVDKKQVGSKEYVKYFNQIQSKHIDFVLSNKQTLQLVTTVELDDSTHQYKDRVERDIFLNNALQTAGVPLIRCTNIGELEEQLNNLLIKVSGVRISDGSP